MKRRLGFWAVGGLLVACFWVLLGLLNPDENFGRWTIAALTAPASVLGRAIPLAFYWFILLNAAIYAIFGLATELLVRRRS